MVVFSGFGGLVVSFEADAFVCFFGLVWVLWFFFVWLLFWFFLDLFFSVSRPEMRSKNRLNRIKSYFYIPPITAGPFQPFFVPKWRK